MALLGAGAEQVGADYALAFAVVNLTWAVGQFFGATLSGALAGTMGDLVPCVAVGAICLLTLALTRGWFRGVASEEELTTGSKAASK